MWVSIGMTIAWLFGQRVTAKTGKVIGIVACMILAVALLSIGKCAYDANVIDEHENKREAEIAKGVLKADRGANAGDLARDEEFAKAQANIAGAMSDAEQNDPEHGRTPVGPVSQSYYDSLRDDRNRPAGR